MRREENISLKWKYYSGDSFWFHLNYLTRKKKCFVPSNFTGPRFCRSMAFFLLFSLVGRWGKICLDVITSLYVAVVTECVRHETEDLHFRISSEAWTEFRDQLNCTSFFIELEEPHRILVLTHNMLLLKCNNNFTALYLLSLIVIWKQLIWSSPPKQHTEAATCITISPSSIWTLWPGFHWILSGTATKGRMLCLNIRRQKGTCSEMAVER